MRRALLLLILAVSATTSAQESEPAQAPPPEPASAAQPTPAEPKPEPERTPEPEPAQKPEPKPEAKPAQAPAPKPPPPAIPAPAPAPAPPAAAAAPSPEPSPGDQEAVKLRAKAFFHSLLLADARSLVEQSTFPFVLEERQVNSGDELLQEWLKQLRRKRTDLLTLYGIEVLTPAEMEKKHGKPPARLSTFPIRGPRTYLAVANLSGHAAVVVYRLTGQDWRAIGYHD